MTQELMFHTLGRYASYYVPTANAIELRDIEKNVKVAVLQDNLDLSEAIDLLDNQMCEIGLLSFGEIMFLLNCAASVEQNLEFAEHDLKEFGEVGVSG